MVEVITSGQCDIIGAARPSIADPFLPLKIKEGRLDDIRECIGCNVCISRWEIGGPPLVCTQNATSGEEYRRGWHPEKFTTAANADNDVLVIGAGPAGMECAMVLGKRGFRRVHLVESAPEIGGQMRWVPKLPGLGEWGRVVNYRQIQLDKLKNVEVMTGTTLDAEGVLEYGADIVVVATGSHWARDGFQGLTNEPIPGADASLAHVVTPEQVMLEGKAVGQRVVVYDCETYFTGVGMAEKLVREGKDVTYVTAFDGVAPYTRYTLEYPRLSRSLRELGIDVVLEHVLVSVEPGSAPLADIWTDEERIVEADTVVLVTQRISDDALYYELAGDEDGLAAAGIKGLYQIGDCQLPSLIAEAVFSGHRLAREIDSPNPRVPLPYIRERRLVNATDADFRLDSAATGAIAG
jgi:dimethylamine/trimethylamine dehydrogenase